MKSIQAAITLVIVSVLTLSVFVLSGSNGGGCLPPPQLLCPKGEIWDETTEKCVPGCFTDADCPEDTTCTQVYCFAYPCYNQCLPKTCKEHTDCGENQYCDDGQCQKLGFCKVADDCIGQPLIIPACVGYFTCDINQCHWNCGPLYDCTPVQPEQWGPCAMMMGVVWDGTGCVNTSGCGCDKETDPNCARIFPDLQTCESKTSHCYCKAVKPGQWGMCDMLMGVIWNGTECKYASGCGCDKLKDPDCARIFESMEECQKKTADCK